MKKNALKKLASAVLAGTMVFALAACGSSSSSSAATSEAAAADSSVESKVESKVESTVAKDSSVESTVAAATDEGPVELVVFAAASMTETLTEIKDMYEAEHPNVTVTYNFDSSGTLLEQILQGANCDLFISAAQKQMNALDVNADAEKNPDGNDYLVEGSRIDILENKVTLVVPEGNPKGVESFDDMATKLQNGEILIGLGNSDVPVGQYSSKILTYFGLDEEALASAGSITYGSNVKEVTTQVSEASVDCGIIYCTDAFSAGLDIVDEATVDMCGQVIYPAAVLNTSNYQTEAQEFLDYLTTDECMAIFEKVGFSPVA